MEARKVIDAGQDEAKFDTGCAAHLLRCAEGLLGIRNAPPESCIKGMGGTATITYVGQMLGIDRVFVAPEGANLISVSQLAIKGRNFIRNKNEMIVRDKDRVAICF